MNHDELKKALETAALMANAVPENLQGIAFSKVFELLISAPQSQSKQPAASAANSQTKAKPASTKSRPGRPGPKAALAAMSQGGFFDSLRTVAEMQEHLKNKKGHDYPSKDLSKSALRLVREGILDREAVAEGGYVYKKH